VPLGFAHYSYANVCRKFTDMFGNFGIAVVDLPMPEIYANVDSVATRSAGHGRHAHLCFKPFNEIRLLKGAVNIGWLAWEFDQLPSFERASVDGSRRWNIFNDYKFMLAKLDEVWVGCSYTRDVFHREGIGNVQVVPAPIAMPSLPDTVLAERSAPGAESEPPLTRVDADLASIATFLDTNKSSERSISSRVAQARQRGGRVFLSIFNPGDIRKNAPALLAGFQRHVQRSKANDILIVKFVVDGTVRNLATVLREDMPLRFVQSDLLFSLIDSPHITYVTGNLDDAGMKWLYAMADFYLCASSAEGQNLPLLEAISRGVVPVSTACTAMADYITEGNACVTATKEQLMAHEIASTYGLANVTWRQADFRDVARALDRSSRLDPDALRDMRRHGFGIVRDDFGHDAIFHRVRSRLAALGCDVF
jgi:glycosyltransferase involved in cell wall biosynthesis